MAQAIDADSYTQGESMNLRQWKWVVVMLSFCSTRLLAQASQEKSENGAVLVYADIAGASFGLPANKAVALTTVTTVVGGRPITTFLSAVSPDKTVLWAPSIGVAVTAWKFFVPFIDVTVFNRGKATATAGPQTVVFEDTGNTFAYNAGLTVMAGKSKRRAFVEM